VAIPHNIIVTIIVTIETSQLSTGTVLLAHSKIETTAKRPKTGYLRP
jgi:hypothetical protein